MSEPSPDEIAEARRWLAEADEELVVVDVLLANDRVPVRAACFHAHLAAEKALKALVIFRAVPVPKAHDLARLLQMLPAADGNRFAKSELADLNPWTVEGRYPADLSEPTDAEVGALGAAAHRVVEAARTVISP